VSPAVDPLIGSVIAERYEVIRVIGKGGMGTIYEVRNTRLGRSFALKTLSSGSENEEVLARFRREAEIVASLNHPNILDVVDWDTLDDGSPCMVMEYLRGEDLSTRIRVGGPLAWPDFARIADQVLAALAVAHRAGVVHRDLKPQNIFLAADDNGDESVKLLDFGISKLRDARTFTTTDAKVMGTPAYMPPEQAEGRQEDVGPASDVWAMGTIFYEMATGTVAFEGSSVPAILYKVCHGRPRPILELRPNTPPKLVAVIEHTLMPRIADRLPTAEKLRSDLRSALSSIGGISWPEPLRSRTGPALGQRAPAPTPASSVAVASTASTRSVANAPTMAAGQASLAAQAAVPASRAEIRASSEAPRRRRFWLIAAPLVAIAVGGGIAVVASSGSSSSTSSPSPTAPAAPVVTGGSTAPRPVTDPPATVPARVIIHIDSTPHGAEIFRLPSEAMVGLTPWMNEVDRSEGTAVFVVKKPGYIDRRVEIDLRVGGPILVVLSREKVRTSVKPPISKPPIATPDVHQDRKKGDPIDPFATKNKP
jgi:serine/threonine protein kinase